MYFLGTVRIKVARKGKGPPNGEPRVSGKGDEACSIVSDALTAGILVESVPHANGPLTLAPRATIVPDLVGEKKEGQSWRITKEQTTGSCV